MHYCICSIKLGQHVLARRPGRPESPTDGARQAVNTIRAVQRRLSITDEALAKRAGVDQSSVSRALRRDPPAWTPSLRKLWTYAENQASDAQPGAGEPGVDRIARAVRAAWDGTPEGMDLLLRLLALARELRRRR